MKTIRMIICLSSLQASLLSCIADEVMICKCASSIKSDFATLNIDAAWDVEWPYKIQGVSSNTLQRIHKQICYDAFVSPILGDKDEASNEMPTRADFAQAYLFRTALDKVVESEDSFTVRSFVFNAYLNQFRKLHLSYKKIKRTKEEE